MKKIDEIWRSLESDNTVTNGVGLRRYSGTVLPDLFVAVRGPLKVRCIATSIGSKIKLNISSFDNLEDIEVEILPDIIGNDKNLLLIKLINNRHHDIFSVLCEDLIECISTLKTENEVVIALFNRLEHWKSLFDKAASEGLSSEEQRGLYGELFFLRKYISRDKNYLKVINSWLGPDKDVRDFQSNQWAVEVKTTKGNNHQKVLINSERQLDTTNIPYLFLYHLSLEVLNNSGESLNEIIDAIYRLLESDFSSLNKFESKLLAGGYFASHKDLYAEKGYTIRLENFYKVEGMFPRIEERDIRNGIGDIKYSVILSNCFSFILSEQEVFQTISLHE